MVLSLSCLFLVSLSLFSSLSLSCLFLVSLLSLSCLFLVSLLSLSCLSLVSSKGIATVSHLRLVYRLYQFYLIFNLPNITILGLGYLSSLSGTRLTPEIMRKIEKSSCVHLTFQYQCFTYFTHSEYISQQYFIWKMTNISEFGSAKHWTMLKTAFVSPSDNCRNITRRK